MSETDVWETMELAWRTGYSFALIKVAQSIADNGPLTMSQAADLSAKTAKFAKEEMESLKK